MATVRKQYLTYNRQTGKLIIPTLYKSRDSDYVCGSYGTPLSTSYQRCVELITECHNSHKHSHLTNLVLCYMF